MRANRLGEVTDAIEALTLWARHRVPAQVSSTTVTTLDTLAHRGPSRISDLAVSEAISQPGMTGLVNRLEAAGRAERIPDPVDGRATLVRITPAGRQVLADRHAARAGAMLAELNRLDGSDRAALVAALPAIERLVRGADTRSTAPVSAEAGAGVAVSRARTHAPPGRRRHTAANPPTR